VDEASKQTTAREEIRVSELVVVTYPDVYRAGEVCATLQRLHKQFLIEIEDIAFITREEDGKLKLHQTTSVAKTATGIGIWKGTLWGGLIGLLFLQPALGMITGAALGAAGGAIAGKAVDYGISNSFMKELGERVQPGTSALFVLFRKATWEKVLDQIAQYGGTVMHSSLSPEAEARLQEALTAEEPSKAA
jgi:uncharacterized membrane protein